MGKIDDAQEILKSLGMPSAQQNEMSALTLLALCGLEEETPWQMARQQSLTVTKGIMNFVHEKYNRDYAPNTRETFRRQVLHQFTQGNIVNYNPDIPNLPTNSPRAHYALTNAALTAIQSFGTSAWPINIKEFLDKKGNLRDVYRKERSHHMIPITLSNGNIIELTPGKHNEVQAKVIYEFGPRFAPGSELLYIGDTAKKDLHLNIKELTRLGIPVSDHGKLPDIIIYDRSKDWIFLIEVVTSHGPMNPKRIFELKEMLKHCKAGMVYVSAFPDFIEFRKHLKEIAWETEVWIAENPDHMIHYDGERFIGPMK